MQNRPKGEKKMQGSSIWQGDFKVIGCSTRIEVDLSFSGTDLKVWPINLRSLFVIVVFLTRLDSSRSLR
ncbi:hypothetical protein Syun_021290 [Stephania yunnanensis]|uniref:Uncharacterized protein n=1 Tax=Stephania yunnanensis TaxID=152371 RepID=A0AAP0IFI6_9MAGN